VRRRVRAAAVGLALLNLLITPVFGLTAGSTSPEALSKSGRAHMAYARLIVDGVPSDVLDATGNAVEPRRLRLHHVGRGRMTRWTGTAKER
jgi:hypothetical protein